jgi:hypothetical protein
MSWAKPCWECGSLKHSTSEHGELWHKEEVMVEIRKLTPHEKVLTRKIESRKATIKQCEATILQAKAQIEELEAELRLK